MTLWPMARLAAAEQAHRAEQAGARDGRRAVPAVGLEGGDVGVGAAVRGGIGPAHAGGLGCADGRAGLVCWIAAETKARSKEKARLQAKQVRSLTSIITSITTIITIITSTVLHKTREAFVADIIRVHTVAEHAGDLRRTTTADSC